MAISSIHKTLHSRQWCGEPAICLKQALSSKNWGLVPCNQHLYASTKYRELTLVSHNAICLQLSHANDNG